MPAAKRTLYPIFSETDREAASGILKDLQALGFPSSEKTPKKSGVLLLFLSEALQKDEALQSAFLSAYGRKVPVIPVSLDGSDAPEALKDALYAYNTIYAERYSGEELASRIASAEVLQKNKSRLPVLIAVSAGILLLVAAGIIIWRLWPKNNGGNATEAAEPTEPPVIPEDAGIRPEDLENVFELLIVGDRFFYATAEQVRELQQTDTNGYMRIGASYLATRTSEEDGMHWYSTDDGHEIEMARWDDLNFLKYMKNLRMVTLVRVEGTFPDLTELEYLMNVEVFDCDIPDISGAMAPNLEHFGFFGNYIPDFTPLNSGKRIASVNFHLYHMDVADLSAFGPPSLTRFSVNGNYSNTEVRLDGLKNCTNLSSVTLIRLPNEDLSFLSENTDLEDVGVWELWNLRSLHGLENKPKLREFWTLTSFELSDLSALSGNASLEEVNVENILAEDCSWLSGADSLQYLSLSDCRALRSFRGLENHANLRELRCESSENLTDISALRGCASLEKLVLFDTYDLTDISAVTSLPKLKNLQTYGNSLSDVNFLYDIKNKDGFSFGISGVRDWSGLQAITKYEFLNITDKNGTAFPYIKDATVNHFQFYNRTGRDDWGREELDLKSLPTVTDTLELHGVPSLKGLPAFNLFNVKIYESPYLTSLDGLQNLEYFGENGGTLYIEQCPRLTDWSALEGMQLTNLQLKALFTLPSFTDFFCSRIELNSIVGLTDLHCFDNMNPEKSVSIRLVDVDELTDLSPLYTMTKGFTLEVPAHLSAQAEALVESGIFKEYVVTYPDYSWSLAEMRIRLISLDELNTLPEAVLSHVDEFAMAGDILFSTDEYWVEEDWSTDPVTLYLHAHDSEEDIRIEIEDGTMLTDLSVLSKLTGLKSLQLYRQPLENLDGIQALTSLEDLRVVQSPALTDASAAFALQGLRWVDLQDTALSSIEGIQNLYELESLNLDNTNVTDFSPLEGLSDDLNVNFRLPLMTYEEFAALPQALLSRVKQAAFVGGYAADPWSPDWWFEEDWSTNPATAYLHINSTDESIPLSYGTVTDLADLPDMPRLEVLFLRAQDLSTLEGIEKYPSLRQVELRLCPNITDLSTLYDLPGIEEICINNCPVDSIEGIGKMKTLTQLQLGGTDVTDFSPFEEIDFSYSETLNDNGWAPHFSLALNDMQDKIPAEQYQLLSRVHHYDSLNMYNTDCRLWVDALKESEIRNLYAGNCGWTDELLKEFAEAHPELEELDISWDSRDLDLSPLLSMPNLRLVRVSHNMEGAIRSLGEEYRFELSISY